MQTAAADRGAVEGEPVLLRSVLECEEMKGSRDGLFGVPSILLALRTGPRLGLAVTVATEPLASLSAP